MGLFMLGLISITFLGSWVISVVFGFRFVISIAVVSVAFTVPRLLSVRWSSGFPMSMGPTRSFMIFWLFLIISFSIIIVPIIFSGSSSVNSFLGLGLGLGLGLRVRVRVNKYDSTGTDEADFSKACSLSH